MIFFLKSATFQGFAYLLGMKYNLVFLCKIVSTLKPWIKNVVISSFCELCSIIIYPPAECVPTTVEQHMEKMQLKSQGQFLSHGLATTSFFPSTIRSQPVSPLLRDPGEDPKAAKTRVPLKQLKR